MISILHPSRSRPQKSFDTVNRWIQKAGTTDLEVIISLDKHDSHLGNYYALYDKISNQVLIYVGDNKNAVEAINAAARIAKGNIIIVVSDDTDCCPNWANKIIKYTEHKSDWVMKVQDGIQPKIITMPIMDRVYYQRDGFIYNPAYSHAWSDREFTEVAHRRKIVITKNIMFKHLHYSVLKNKKRDEQYARTDATFESGKKIFIQRQKMNFGL